MNFSEIGLKDLVLDFDSNDLQDITIVQGDTKTRGFKVLVSTNNGEIIKASSNYEMRLYGINSNYPDKSFFTKGTIDGDFYKVYISTDMASKSGKLQLQLALFEGTNALIQSRIKEVDVYQSIANGGNVGKDLVVDFGKLQDALGRVDAQEKKYDESLVRQEAVESKINQKHTEVVQIRDGLKGVLNTENARVEAEKKRISAENTRVSQEKTRQSNESTRNSQEKTRQTQEQQRVDVERQRQSQEQSRVDAESKRAKAEVTREQSEQTRTSKETERQSNENTRQSNEKTRLSQENSRVEAEKKRKSTFDTWDKTMKNVIESEHLHIAYADSEDGSANFSKKEANRKFIGQYVDYEEDGSDDYKKYKWSLIKGADGGNFTWNLIKKSRSDLEILTWRHSKLEILDKNYQFPELNVNDAKKIQFSGGDGDLKGFLSYLANLDSDMIKGNKYTVSLYVENLSDTELKIEFNGFDWQSHKLKPSEKRYVVCKGEYDGNGNQVQFLANSDKEIIFAYGLLKAENGYNDNPIWSPHISEINGKDGVDGKDGTFTGEIGGRNLIRNSDKITGWTKYDGGNHTITDEFMKEFNVQGQRIKSEAGKGTDFIKTYVNFDVDNLVADKTYTFSIYVKNNRDVPAQLRVNGFNCNFAYELNANECKRFIITGQRDNMEGYWKNRIQLQLRGADKSHFVDMTVARPQLELGSIATDWAPNPSDFQSDITNLTKNVDTKVSSDTVNNIAIIEKGASTTNIPANTLIFEKE